LDSLTERVPGAVFEVTNTLGAGFLDKVYRRALLTELGLAASGLPRLRLQSPTRVTLSESTWPICSSKTCWRSS
jgi:hypothetical protein